MFRKTKLSSAVAIALTAAVSATMLTGLTGCNLTDAGSSLTSGSVNTVTNPKGTIVGNVVDTNGLALSGVNVYAAGQKTTTDVGGNYRFNNVGVVNTAGADANTGHAPIVVTIEAPAGYLGASVDVSPNAQVDGTIADTVTQNGATLFIDGYIASTGSVALPALTSRVIGVLRDEVTGEPIDGATVFLDMTAVTSSSVQQGTVIGFQAVPFTATTGADGTFAFDNMPADSSLRLAAQLDENTVLEIVGAPISANTDDESVVFDFGNVQANRVVHKDDINPFVISVNGVQDKNANPGVFNDDIDGTFATGGIVINFSEPLIVGEVDDNSFVPYVYDTQGGVDGTGAYLAVDTTNSGIAADGMSMTVATTDPIPAGHTVEINLLRADFQDLAENVISIGGTGEVGFASHQAANSIGDALYRLDLKIFDSIDTDANDVTLTQMSEDTLGTNDFDAVQVSNDSFTDVEDGSTNGTFHQLDSADNDAGGFIDAEERKSAVVAALGADSVVSSTGRVTFTPDNATEYEILVFAPNGNDNNAAVITIGSTPDGDVAISAPNGGNNSFTIDGLNGSIVPIELLVTNVEPGTVLRITPSDDLGNPGTSTSVTLVDNVTPTTSLQDGYNQTGDDTTNAVTSITFGGGGENSNIGSSTIGVPVWAVTAGLLDNKVYDGTTVVSVNIDGVSDNDLQAELMENNTVDTTGSGLPFITPAPAGPYDATAYAAFTLDRTVGFAMTEDVTVTGTPAFSGTNATITNYVENNDVQVNDDAGVVNVDLVIGDVDDIVALAADDGAVVNFATAITDEAGNVAVDASVAIRDDLPPMIVSAVYNGTNFVVTFNEAVDINFAVDVLPLTGFGDLGLTNSSLDGTATILTVLPEVGAAPTGAWIDDAIVANADTFGDLDRATVFNLSQYSETGTVTYTVQNANNSEGHAVLSAVDINDVNGNDWTNDPSNITSYATFAAIDATGDFEVSTSPANLTAGATTASLVYVFTHPLDVATVFATCATAGLITETNGNFNIAGGTAGTDGAANCFTSASGIVTSTGASYVASTRTLTVNLGFPAVASGDDITWTAGNAVGEYDSVNTVPAADASLSLTTN